MPEDPRRGVAERIDAVRASYAAQLETWVRDGLSARRIECLSAAIHAIDQCLAIIKTGDDDGPA